MSRFDKSVYEELGVSKAVGIEIEFDPQPSWSACPPGSIGLTLSIGQVRSTITCDAGKFVFKTEELRSWLDRVGKN